MISHKQDGLHGDVVDEVVGDDGVADVERVQRRHVSGRAHAPAPHVVRALQELAARHAWLGPVAEHLHHHTSGSTTVRYRALPILPISDVE